MFINFFKIYKSHFHSPIFSFSQNFKQIHPKTYPNSNFITPKSINPTQNNVAFGYYFPKQWSQQQIIKRIDPSKNAILNIKILRNRLGQHSGKILFTFKNNQVMNTYIKKYNQDFIQTADGVQKIVLKQFQLKVKVPQNQQKKAGVRISNIDYDLTQNEIKKIAEDFGKVVDIQLPKRPDGKNKGYGIVYFSNWKQVREFYEFADGLPFLGRKIRVQIMDKNDKKKQQQERLQLPKVTLQENQKLYKEIISRKSQKIS